VRGQALLVAVTLAAVADGRPLSTGEAHRVGRGREEPQRVYWATTISDELAMVQPQPGGAAFGDRFDLVDGAGYLGRAVVERVDDIRCGETTYARAQVRFVDGRLSRDSVGQIAAIRPTLARPQLARVLDAGAERTSFPARSEAMFQLVDLDGDRIPDLASQISLACRPVPTAAAPKRTTSCVEVWRRDAGGWRLVDRVEIPPCR
jgi:hypothetical protein